MFDDFDLKFWLNNWSYVKNVSDLLCRGLNFLQKSSGQFNHIPDNWAEIKF